MRYKDYQIIRNKNIFHSTCLVKARGICQLTGHVSLRVVVIVRLHVSLQAAVLLHHRSPFITSHSDIRSARCLRQLFRDIRVNKNFCKCSELLRQFVSNSPLWQYSYG